MPNDIFQMRSKHALTQQELGLLLGLSQTVVARLENDQSDHSEKVRLQTAFALHVIFGKRPAHLFADLFNETEEAVMRIAADFDRKLEGRTDRAAIAQRALLADIVRRASSRPATV